jgi:hypothetical protein
VCHIGNIPQARKNPKPGSPSYATHWEFYFYLSQTGTKPQAHKTKFLKRFCICVIFGPYHKLTNPQPSSPLYATHWELYFYLSQIGTKPHAHKTKFEKTFFYMCLIFGLYHKPTNPQLSFLCYTFKVIFLPLSDWDQTTSPQNKVNKTCLHMCHIWTMPQAHKLTAQLSFICYT